MTASKLSKYGGRKMKFVSNSLMAIVMATMLTIALSAQQSSTDNHQKKPKLGRDAGHAGDAIWTDAAWEHEPDDAELP
jgi:basic membrane lipoprotein Med (substrate-binding protein (PBP1-ABC) superfamily)